MRKLFLSVAVTVLALSGQAQFSIGADGISVKAGTIVAVDSLVLVSASDMNLTANSIQVSYTPIAASGGGPGSIARVYTFDQPMNFTGTAGILYDDAELAGLTELSLQMASTNTYGSSTIWTASASTILDPVANYIYSDYTSTPLARLTATAQGIVLPIIYNRLEARLQHDKVLVSWTLNKNDLYTSMELFSSADGANWKSVASPQIKPVTDEASYTFDDYDFDFTMRYYKVSLHEKSGRQAWTNTATVRKEEISTLTIVNQSSSAICLFKGQQPVQVQVFDMGGKLVFNRDHPEMEFVLSGLASGVYMLRYTLEDHQVRAKKFMID